MHSYRRCLTALVAGAALAVCAAPARANELALPGAPLTVHVGDQGQMQAFRAGEPSGIFFPPDSALGDAGFFLAFPDDDGTEPAEDPFEGKVYGFDGGAGPDGLELYTPVSQGPVTGSGAAGDPFTQVTVYKVVAGAADIAEVTQTTTYVNGEQRFVTTWAVKNVSSGTLHYKALVAADFFFEGSDQGTGVFTVGPPRFIGGTNADTGRSGGFVEAGPPSPPWSYYQALYFAFADPLSVWGRVETSADSLDNVFDDTVKGEPDDNAGAVEWDQALSDPLPALATRTYSVITRSALPAALQLSPPNAGSPQGTAITYTATAKDTDGTPFAGRTLRYSIVGANPTSNATTIDSAGNAPIVDPGTNAGTDTVIAFVDFNNNGVREPAEPQASALGTFIDNIPPSCKVSVVGDRPVAGGGQGKPIVITVSCDSPATVTGTTTFIVPLPKKAGTSAVAARKRTKKIRLKPVVTTVAPGQATPVKIKVPKKVARKYAGRKLKAKIKITAVDAAGNSATAKTTKKIKLKKLKKKRR